MILLLFGPRDSGKTSLLKRAAAHWRSRGLAVRGFVSEKVMDGPKTRGYDLLDLAGGERCALFRREGDPGWQRTGPYFMLPAGLALAESLLARAGEGDLAVVDEIGPLETRKGGFYPSLEPLLRRPVARLVLTVQERILRDFLHMSGLEDITWVDAERGDAYDRLIDEVEAP